MNSFSTVSHLARAGVDQNSLIYIQSLSLGFSLDVEGPDVLSSYGINILNQNNTFLRVKKGNNLATLSDVTRTGNCTFYVKYNCRFSTDNILGHGCAIVPSCGDGKALVGNSLTIKYYSLFDSAVYYISGVDTSDISNASTTGTIYGNYQVLTYNITAIIRKVLKFSVGNQSTTVQIPDQVFYVTVSGGVYFISTGGTIMQQPNLVFTSGKLYLFDQSEASNQDYAIVFGLIPDIAPLYTTNVVTNGTAGSTNAYTLVDFSGVTVPNLYYYNLTNQNMGGSAYI